MLLRGFALTNYIVFRTLQIAFGLWNQYLLQVGGKHREHVQQTMQLMFKCNSHRK